MKLGLVTKPTSSSQVLRTLVLMYCDHADDWFPGYTSHIIQSLTLAASPHVQVLLDVKWLCGVSWELDRGGLR